MAATKRLTRKTVAHPAFCESRPFPMGEGARRGSDLTGAGEGRPGQAVATLPRQHFLNFWPLPQGQGSLRPTSR